MPDIICPLLNLPDHRDLLARLRAEGIDIYRARPWERSALVDFIGTRFGQGWVDETLLAFSRQPISAIIAVEGQRIIGFAAFEVSAPAYFGPTGVDEAYRGRGIGKALLLEALVGLRELGYIYGFIGAPGPKDFYLQATPGLLLPAEWTTIHTLHAHAAVEPPTPKPTGV
ncbi:MAG: GNAT family N-acetyltransferase [Armatimonadota bacterium]